jgi:hypothetical protein
VDSGKDVVGGSVATFLFFDLLKVVVMTEPDRNNNSIITIKLDTPAPAGHVSSRLTPHASRLTPHASRLTPHASRLTPHASRLTPHASRLTPHASRLTPHASRLTPASTVAQLKSRCSSDFSGFSDFVPSLSRGGSGWGWGSVSSHICPERSHRLSAPHTSAAFLVRYPRSGVLRFDLKESTQS